MIEIKVYWTIVSLGSEIPKQCEAGPFQFYDTAEQFALNLALTAGKELRNLSIKRVTLAVNVANQ